MAEANAQTVPPARSRTTPARSRAIHATKGSTTTAVSPPSAAAHVLQERSHQQRATPVAEIVLPVRSITKAAKAIAWIVLSARIITRPEAQPAPPVRQGSTITKLAKLRAKIVLPVRTAAKVQSIVLFVP